MMRIFLALCLNDIALKLLDGLGRSVLGARIVPAGQHHCTIRFIGDIEGGLYHDINEQLQTLESPAVTLSIKGVGHFPPRGNPRILWAGIEQTGDLILLRNRVYNILKQCGIAPEKRKFHPHITLARLSKSSPERVARFLADNNSLEIPPFQVNRLTLFSSRLTPEGAVHTIEGRYPFAG